MITGKVLSFEESIEGLKNIIINIEYTMPDGKKVLSPYIAQSENFRNKTEIERDNFIKAQIEFQCERYLEAYIGELKADKDYIKKELEILSKTLYDDFQAKLSTVNATLLSELSIYVGVEYPKEKVVIKFADTGANITEQLNPELAAKYKIVKQMSVDEAGNITVSDVVSLKVK